MGLDAADLAGLGRLRGLPRPLTVSLIVWPGIGGTLAAAVLSVLLIVIAALTGDPPGGPGARST